MSPGRGLGRGENFRLHLTTASVQCLRLLFFIQCGCVVDVAAAVNQRRSDGRSQHRLHLRQNCDTARWASATQGSPDIDAQRTYILTLFFSVTIAQHSAGLRHFGAVTQLRNWGSPSVQNKKLSFCFCSNLRALVQMRHAVVKVVL